MFPIRTILHPTDFSQQSANAFRLACALARDHDAGLIVLHVLPPPAYVYGNGVIPPEPEDYLEQVRTKLAAVQPDSPEIVIERRLMEGDPVAEILYVAKMSLCDLIVMGTHGWTGLSRLVMGSVAEGVVRRAPCPVLTVKAPFPQAAPAEAAEPVAALSGK